MLVIALAALPRFLFIGRFEVWLDEAYCFAVARQPLSGIIADLAYDNGPPFYYLMLHYWMRLFGESAAAMRSLSAIFSIGMVTVLLAWNTPWLSRAARLWAGFVLAITPLSIYYAQEARMYSPVAFFVLLSMVFLERGVRVGGFCNWAFCCVATALSLYTSYAAVFVLPVGYIAIAAAFLRAKDSAALRRRLTRLLAAHSVAAILFAAWLPTYFRQPSAEAIQWIRPTWQQEKHKALIPAKALLTMGTGGAYYPSYLRNLRVDRDRVMTTREAIEDGREKRFLVKVLAAVPPAVPLMLCITLVIILVVLALMRSSTEFPCRAFLAAWIACSFGVPYLLSFLRPMYVPGRYDLTGVAAFAVVQGIALSRLKRGLRVLVAALLTALFVYEYGYMQLWPSTARFSPKATALSSSVSEGDVVLGLAFEYGQTYYHIGPMRDRLTWITFPRDTRKHFAWIDYDKWLEPGWESPRDSLREEAYQTIAEAAKAAGPGRAVAIVRVGNPPTWIEAMDQALQPAVVEAVQSGMLLPDMVKSKPQLGIVVLRVERVPANASRDAPHSTAPGHAEEGPR